MTWQQKNTLYVAVFARFIFGISLLAIAGQSKFPITLTIVGSILMASALLISIIGRAKIARLLNWFNRLPPILIRLWLAVGISFTVFITYAIF